jgi:hypothetical protein
VPHRFCRNHFLRDLAKPVLETDSHVKVQMRRKVRGLRAIEREVLAEQKASPQAATGQRESRAVVLDYCTAVRGILNDGQGGPLRPPGLRMAETLGEVRASLQRNLDAKKRGLRRSGSRAWRRASTAGRPTSKRR